MKIEINNILLKLQNQELCIGDASDELEKLFNKKKKKETFPFSDTDSYVEKLIEDEIGWVERKFKNGIGEIENSFNKFKEYVYESNREIKSSIKEIKSKIEKEDEVQLKKDGVYIIKYEGSYEKVRILQLTQKTVSFHIILCSNTIIIPIEEFREKLIEEI